MPSPDSHDALLDPPGNQTLSTPRPLSPHLNRHHDGTPPRRKNHHLKFNARTASATRQHPRPDAAFAFPPREGDSRGERFSPSRLRLLGAESSQMDRYQRVEKPREESPIGANEIRITAQGRPRNYITYALALVQVRVRSTATLCYFLARLFPPAAAVRPVHLYVEGKQPWFLPP